MEIIEEDYKFKYDCVYLVSEFCTCYDKVFQDFISFVNKIGRVVKKEDLGIRRLAYKIKEEERARYYVITYKGDMETTREIEKWLRECSPVIKFMTMRLEE